MLSFGHFDVCVSGVVVEMATIGTAEESLLVSVTKEKKVERLLPILQMRSVLFEMGNKRVIIVVYGPQEVVSHPKYYGFVHVL
ncbi:hypothetical protein GUJ93_ZPchr0002g23458 [Zizania palustris]|uniref:Uncharacterized protein n=1 Tax=Zizania palustris TaxID=103762 RepID=A0A8J5RIF1_ZIZPA|nr:hypothetical protein GUJ93_ZPchr0002g23458 [Zizania palustris]